MSKSWMRLRDEPPLKAGEPYPLFNRVSIETVGRCTRECLFCPSRFRTKEQQGEMSDEVFITLMRQLMDLKFKGTIQLFYLGEPLLDKKLVTRIKFARRMCPKSKILIASNGDLLNKVEQVNDLFDAGLNVLNVDCYNHETYKKIEDLSFECDGEIEVCYDSVHWTSKSHTSKHFIVADVSVPKEAWKSKCHTYLIPEIERELAKTGSLPDKKQRYCAVPHRRLTVWWDGTIVLCCVVTPLMTSPVITGTYCDILAAWNSPIANKYRYWLQNAQKRGVCKDCWYRGSYSHVMQRIEKPDGVE